MPSGVTPLPAHERLILNISEVARELGLCRNSVRKLMAEGKLKSTKLLGRNVIPRSELDRFLAALVAELG